MRKAKKWIALFFLLLSFSGCSYHSVEAEPAPQCRVVTEMTVVCQNGPITCKRYYSDGEKMRRILNYLRQIDPYGAPEVDPAQMGGNDVYIVLSHSDGCIKVYHQKADSYMMIDNGPWEAINPSRGKELEVILGEMESDPEI